MGLPAREIRGFPARRVDPYRAGITTTTFGWLMQAPDLGNFWTAWEVYFQRNVRCYHTPLSMAGPPNCSIVNIKLLPLFSESPVVKSPLVPTARPSR